MCDPALGSGFFPLRLVENLLASGKFSRDRIARWEIENLYGVDTDAGAVYLAKVFLWLTLSGAHRVYVPLSGHFVCGDSLLGPGFAGSGAWAGLDWKWAFPDIAADGGFDVVIGKHPSAVLTNFSRYPQR